MDPIALLRSRYDTLTNAEQKLADYIISNPRCMLEGRMSQLSKNAGSSQCGTGALVPETGLRRLFGVPLFDEQLSALTGR